MRFPKKTYQKINQLYSNNRLLHHPLIESDGSHVGYNRAVARTMKAYVESLVRQSVDSDKIFSCEF